MLLLLLLLMMMMLMIEEVSINVAYSVVKAVIHTRDQYSYPSTLRPLMLLLMLLLMMMMMMIKG